MEEEEYEMVWDQKLRQYKPMYYVDPSYVLSKEEEAKVKFMDKLKDKDRRVTSGKLYKILNKEGKLVPFIPNAEQLDYFRNKHKRNVIVKARQLWFSTLIQVDMFDDVLWNKNMHAAVIAQDSDTATEIFDKKIKVMWENLPKRLKEHLDVKRERSNMFFFGRNGSSIRTAVKLRGTTVRRLHISEFWYTSVHDRKKADEIFNGAIEAVPVDGIVTIESTAEGAEGLFYEIAKGAKQIKDMALAPHDMQWKLFFYPWHEHLDYSIDSNVWLTSEEQEYFTMLDNKQNIKLSQGQKKWYALKWRDKKDAIYKEYPSYFDEAFNLSIKGSYYEKDLELARRQGRVWLYPWNPQLEVMTSWDLWGSGWGDTTCVWFEQVWQDKVYCIDYLEFDNMSWLEQLQIVKARGWYNVTKWIGPHDIRNNHDGMSKRDLAKQMNIEFIVVKKSMNLTNDIQMVRTVMPKMRFDELHCKLWLDRLALYRRGFDEKNGIFVDTPAHNGASHGCDALRTFAIRFLKEEARESEKWWGFVVQGWIHNIDNMGESSYESDNLSFLN